MLGHDGVARFRLRRGKPLVQIVTEIVPVILRGAAGCKTEPRKSPHSEFFRRFLRFTLALFEAPAKPREKAGCGLGARFRPRRDPRLPCASAQPRHESNLTRALRCAEQIARQDIDDGEKSRGKPDRETEGAALRQGDEGHEAGAGGKRKDSRLRLPRARGRASGGCHSSRPGRHETSPTTELRTELIETTAHYSRVLVTKGLRRGSHRHGR